jgi:hypothetical protein
MDADEWIACGARTKLGARHLVRWGKRHLIHLRVVRGRDWDAEH